MTKARSLDVARAAGVSIATVSLVLNGRTQVALSPATRKRVMEAAERLGYRPNRVARSLISGRSQTVGLLLPSLSSSFVARIAEGVEEEATGNDHRILLAHSRHDPEFESRQLDLLLQHKVEGVILVTGEGTLPSLPTRLGLMARNQVPCVVVDDSAAAEQVDCVVSEDQDGMNRAVRHLLELGHRDIAFLGAGLGTSSARDRLAGFRIALGEAGIRWREDRVAGSSYRQPEVDIAADRWFSGPDRPTAVVAANDRHLAALLPILRARGIRVPEDLALLGYANYDFASYLDLSSVEQDPEEMGRIAMRRLLERIGNPRLAPQRIPLPARLVIRTSSGRPICPSPRSPSY